MIESLRTPSIERTSQLAHIGTGRTAQVFTWTPDWVIKLFHPIYPVDLIRYEASVAQCVFEATRAVPQFRVPAVGQVTTFAGSYGLLYQAAQGRTLLDLAFDPAQPMPLEVCAKRLADLHVAVNRVRIESHAALRELPQQDILLRHDIEAAGRLSASCRAQVLRALASLASSDMSLCHGDFHAGNVLISDAGVATLIDWKAAYCGHPMADVARSCLLLRYARTQDAHVLSQDEQHYRMQASEIYLKQYFQMSRVVNGFAQL